MECPHARGNRSLVTPNGLYLGGVTLLSLVRERYIRQCPGCSRARKRWSPSPRSLSSTPPQNGIWTFERE